MASQPKFVKGPKPKYGFSWACGKSYHTVSLWCALYPAAASVSRNSLSLSLCSMATLPVTGTGLPRTSTCSIMRLSGGQSLPVFVCPKNKRSSARIRLASVASSHSNPTSSSSGLYSAQKYELTAANVDLVLEDVRPYLISDGGNVDVVSVEDGVISLRLQGACESCPSSTTTMKMGIERVLKEKFGDAVKDIQQVYDAHDQPRETTVEAVNNHLEILRPAIKNYGGSVEVVSVEGGECLVKYVGPDSIGSGIKAAIKERFPDIINVTFTFST